MRQIRFLLLACATVVVALPSTPAQAQCPAFICYLDLQQGAPPICPNPAVYTSVRVDPIVITSPFNDDCDTSAWFAGVVQVDLPAGCIGLEITVEYDGVPEGWTVNIGDSPTNNGFGGDAGSQPPGQNAELDVLDDQLTLWSGATNASGVTKLAAQLLPLGPDAALKFVVEDQFVSWGSPYTAATSVDDRLFFVPTGPTPPDNRRLFAAFNRVISPVGLPNSSRNGCGVGHVLMFTK